MKKVILFTLFICCTASLVLAKPAFKKMPSVKKARNGYKISFSVTEQTDVDVAIVNQSGKVIRHLASGVLGKNAPQPFKAKKLSQKLFWDMKDDAGNIVKGKFQVRIRLGMNTSVEKYLGWDGHTLNNIISAIAVNEKGELFVVSTDKIWGRSRISVFSRDGSYAKTIFPYPADTPEAKLKDFGRLSVNGEQIPLVINANNGAVQPLTESLRQQEMTFHPDGHLLLHSAIGSLLNQGPAQYLIALSSKGGAPASTGYIGPMIREARGYLGRAGNVPSLPFNGLAVSPDGTWIYETHYDNFYAYDSIKVHAVFRMKWTDEDCGTPFIGGIIAGSDDAHLNTPLGIDTDSKGNIYVCDYGNNRIMIYNPQAKLLGKIPVKNPYIINVHNKTGEIYVLCRQNGNPAAKNPKSRIVKFAPFKSGNTKELYSITCKKFRYLNMALDKNSSPAGIWVVQYAGWQQPYKLFKLTDTGKSFKEGKAINNNNGLSTPLFVASTTDGKKLYVRTLRNGTKEIDVNSGKMKDVKIFNKVNELAISPDGNFYATKGWEWFMMRYDSDLHPFPFNTKNKKLGPWKIGKYGFATDGNKGQGGHGYCFDNDGNLYVIKIPQFSPGQVDVYSPSGKLIKEKLIANLPNGASGITVDKNKNIYIGINLRPEKGTDFYPAGFVNLPVTPWKWYGTERAAPWKFAYFNTYLFHYGQIIKFGPEGGKFYTWKISSKKPRNIPRKAKIYRSGYLRDYIAVEGAKWLYRGGCAPVPASDEKWGKAASADWNIRIDSDDFNRIYVPDAFRFAVNVIDSAGNTIMRIGHYDNCDNTETSGNSSPAFAWPCYVDVNNNKLFVSDINNNRIAVVKLGFDTTETCPINTNE